MTLKLPYRLAAAAGLWLSSAGVRPAAANMPRPPLRHGGVRPIRSSPTPCAQDRRHARACAAVACDDRLRERRRRTSRHRQPTRPSTISASFKARPQLVADVDAGAATALDGRQLDPVSRSAGPRRTARRHAGGPLRRRLGSASTRCRLNGGPAGDAMAPPNMPPYAWPTYAPYNNYSPRRLPERVPVQRVPVHRAVLPVPEGSARLADGHAGVGGRPLVVRPHRRNRDCWQVRFW